MTPDTPLVSIVLPVCNGQPYIGSTLDAALAQTYARFEIVVVDDGSRDDTCAAVAARAARDGRVRLVSQSTRGVAAARNRAIQESRGELIAPLDADDLWEPTKLARQVARLHEAGDGTGLVYSWWIWIDADGRVLDRSPRWRIEGNAADALLQVNYIGCASIPLFRRRDLEAVGGYDETLLDGCEDWDLSLRMAERCGVAVVPAVLVGYRRRRHSMSTETAKMWRAHAAVIDRVRQRRPGLDAATVRRSRDQFALHLAGVSFWGGAYGDAIGWGARAAGSSLARQVAPSVIRLFARTLRPGGDPPAAPPTLRGGEAFAGWPFAEPLIPYDRIYDRRLGRGGRAC